MQSISSEAVVIICDHASITGGLAKIAISQALSLADAGFSVVFIHGDPLREVDARLLRPEINIYCVGSGDYLTATNKIKAGVLGLFDFHVFFALKKLLTTLNFQTIIVHGWAKCLSPSLFVALNKYAAKTLVWNHDYFLVCPNGGYYNYRTQAICQLKPGSVACLKSNCDSRNYVYKLWRFTRHLILNISVKKYIKESQTVCLGNFNQEVVQRFINWEQPPVIVENPIDVRKTERSKAEDNDYFLMIGRISPEKGHVAACRKIKSQFPEVKIKLVGDGDQAILKQLKQAGVDLLGWLPSSEVMVKIRQSRALIFPSVWYEADGLVVLEALSNGIPVLCSDLCAASDQINNGINGYHYSPLDDSILEVMRHMHSDNTVQALSEQAYQGYWRNPRSEKKHVSQLITVMKG